MIGCWVWIWRSKKVAELPCTKENVSQEAYQLTSGNLLSQHQHEWRRPKSDPPKVKSEKKVVALSSSSWWPWDTDEAITRWHLSFNKVIIIRVGGCGRRHRCVTAMKPRFRNWNRCHYATMRIQLTIKPIIRIRKKRRSTIMGVHL